MEQQKNSNNNFSQHGGKPGSPKSSVVEKLLEYMISVLKNLGSDEKLPKCFVDEILKHNTNNKNVNTNKMKKKVTKFKKQRIQGANRKFLEA